MLSRSRKWTPGGKAFAAFVRRHRLTPTEIGTALGVTRPVVYSWLDGSKRPDAYSRAAIEVWTNGEIPASEWWLKSELEALARVVPHVVPPTSKRGSDGRSVKEQG